MATSPRPSSCTTERNWDYCRPASIAWPRVCASESEYATSSGATSDTRLPQTRFAETRNSAVKNVTLPYSSSTSSDRPPSRPPTPPTAVVALLNRFFDVIVDEVDAHGGFVNKFEGDAALAIFGAPTTLDDHAGSALAAARKIQQRLRAEVPEVSAGIGVAAGVAVAGNVGARERFEYTVIGDPVNEAARLSEVAKTVPGNVAASGRAVAAADSAEAAQCRSPRTSPFAAASNRPSSRFRATLWSPRPARQTPCPFSPDPHLPP